MVLTPASNFPLHNKLTGHVRPGPVVNPYFTGRLYDYRESVFKNVQRELPDYVRFRTVMPAWDNTARRQNNPDIFVHSSPGAYQAWLENALETTRELYFGDERIVFINAWNEWAEGAYLEPDQRFGHCFLEATLKAQENVLGARPV